MYESSVTWPEKFEDDIFCGDIMSVSSRGELLVACLLRAADGLLYIFLYDAGGKHNSTIALNNDYMLWDAAWTPSGNIVYTTKISETVERGRIVTITRSGAIINETKVNIGTRKLSVSVDGIIYVAHGQGGVFQSTDDGLTWSEVFASPDNWEFVQAVKVYSDELNNTDVFFAIGSADRGSVFLILRVYTLDRRQIDNSKQLAYSDMAVPNTTDFTSSMLAFDCCTSVFDGGAHEKVVHLFSPSKLLFEQTLNLSDYMKERQYIKSIAVNSQRGLLYVALSDVVKQFTLAYN
jgi:hypothetical protein